MLETVLEENGVNIRSVHMRPPSELAVLPQTPSAPPERTGGQVLTAQNEDEQVMNVDEGVYL